MNKIILLVAVALMLHAVAGHLLTPSAMKKYLSKSQYFKSKPLQEIVIQTSCNKLTLDDQPKASAYSGYLKAFDTQSNSAFGFIFYGSQQANGDPTKFKNYPTIMWLQGGPGGSSQMGNFIEFGPYQPYNNTKTQQIEWKYNQYSWNVDYNLLFLDQPIGVGLGFAENDDEYPVNQDQVAEQLYHGLHELYYNAEGCFNKLAMQETPFFIFGESYAGKYVPAMADYLLRKQDPKIKLKGIGVGDGFTNPGAIMSQMGFFGFNLGMIDVQERSVTESYILEGLWNIRFGQWLDAQQSFDDVMDSVMTPSGFNDVYNFRQQDEWYPVDLAVLLNDPKVKAMYKLIPDITFQLINDKVYEKLSIDFMQEDCVARLERVLAKRLPVLYYNGQNDVIVCTPCTESWLDQVNYSESKEWAGKSFTAWHLNDSTKQKVIGYYKEAGVLSFYLINQAGHMAPFDQPEACLQLAKTFVNKHK